MELIIKNSPEELNPVHSYCLYNEEARQFHSFYTSYENAEQAQTKITNNNKEKI